MTSDVTDGRQRLFVAIDPPRHALDDLAELTARLHTTQAGARPTARERWHVTVAFLGDVPGDRVDSVHRALATAAAGPSAGRAVLRIAGGGKFGGGGGTVLWAGVTGDISRLVRLARAVRRELRRARFFMDRKPYRPHVTLARPGNRLPRALLGQDVATLAGYHGPEWTVHELHLVRSHLGPDPRHVRLASFPLPPQLGN